MMEPARLTPWWIINTFGYSPDANLNAIDFSRLLSHQLHQWSRRSGVILSEENRKWWDISNLQVPVPQTAAELHNHLTNFVLLNYPLRRNGPAEPSISGPIDTTKLTIAVVGDAREVMSRTYLHCLGKLIRMECPELLDAIDIKLLALIYLPHNAHHHQDSDRIAQFLTELHTMMLQPRGEMPFESVAFLQDKNYSAPYGRSGYDQLSSTQIIELMCQTLFHSMISEGMALREISQRYSPVYLSMASVSIYYDWQQHKQKLARKASSTLINTFAFANQAPYVDEGEADIAVASIKRCLTTQSLLTELIEITKTAFQEEQSMLPPDSMQTSETAAHERMKHLYKAVQLSSQRLEESIGVSGRGTLDIQSTNNVIVRSMRELFTGTYGSGNARALEQALLVLRKLEVLFQKERVDLRAETFEKEILSKVLEIADLELTKDAADSERKKRRGDSSLPAMAVLQIGELLSALPLWAKLLTGLLLPASGYLFYWRRKAKQRDHEIKSLSQASTQSLKHDLQHSINQSLTRINFQATTLVHELEVFFEGIRNRIPLPPYPDTAHGYQSTTFCRSVFEELRVPGRPVLKPLIRNGDFAPPVCVGDRRMKFEEYQEHSELGLLINKLLTDKPGVKDCLTLPASGPTDFKELSLKSATEISEGFYEFANDLYEQSPRLGMNDALRQIKKTGSEEGLIAFAAEAAWPPLIFDQTNTQRLPVYLELKYHDAEVFEEVLGNKFNGQWQGVHKELQTIKDGDLLSLGIFQPIPVTNKERCALDSIHTIRSMKTQMSLDELRDPSLVFTLATLPIMEDGTQVPVLVNALEGVRMLPPKPLLRDIEEFRRQLKRTSLSHLPIFLLRAEERKHDLNRPELWSTKDKEEDPYNVVTVVRFKEHVPSKPLRLNHDYVLQAGLCEEGFEFSNGAALATNSEDRPTNIDIMVHAEGMEIEPTWLQPVTLKRKRTPQLAEFTLKPCEKGRKTIHVEFLHANRWLTGIKFEVEVVSQETLALIS